MEATVFNHLYNFFSRYYEDGDFISKRRYSRQWLCARWMEASILLSRNVKLSGKSGRSSWQLTRNEPIYLANRMTGKPTE